MGKVLVTGAAGFLGKNLVENLTIKGVDVVQITRQDGDIRIRSTMDRFLEDNIDHVFHLAGKSFVPESWKSPHEFIDVNFNGVLNVLEFCRSKNISLSYVSSYLYAENVAFPTPEDDVTSPRNPYGLSKYLGEQLCQYYTEYFDMNIQIARPFNIYGPGQNSEFIIPRIINVKRGIDKTPLGDLSVYRDFIHVKDVCEALAIIMTVEGFNIYNIGSGQSTFLADLFEEGSSEMTGNVLLKRQNEISKTQADISKLEKLGWIPMHSVQEYVKQSIQS